MLLETGTTFRLGGEFADDPQVAAALDDAAQVLGSLGLRSAEPADLTVTLARAELLAGSWRLQVAPDEGAVIIAAADAEGARCGLYGFLEALGVRWFSPARPPTLPTLPLELEPLERALTPSFPYRGLHICAGSHHYDPQVGAWMTRLGMNRKLTHHNEVDLLGEELAERGLQPDTAVHAFSFWIPDDPHFAAHPEWFSLVGDRRIRHSEGGQLCVSNLQMRAACADAIAQWVADHPTVRVVGIAPNDGYGWCECAQCRALDTEADRAGGTVNGRTADFVADLCARLLERCPEVLIGHYAYSAFLDFISARESFPPNLMVGCTLSRCYRHAIDDPACPVNAPLYARLQELAARVPHVTVYEYYAHNWGDLPAPQWRVVADDMRAYHRLGLAGFLTEVGGAGSAGWESFHLPIYVASRFLLDVQTDLQAVLDDYCAWRFGPAAEAMAAYLETLRLAVDAMDGCLRHRPRELDLILTPEVRARAAGLLGEAAALAGDGPSAAEIERERERFERWSRLVVERARYAAPDRVTALPLAELALDASPDEQARLALLDRISLLPPERNPAWVAPYADAERIGLLIDCAEERMGDLVIRREHSAGATYASDNVEIFLAASPEAQTVYHFIINPEGYRCASECLGTRWNWAWPGGYEVRTQMRADGWRVLFAIPRADVGAAEGFCFSVVRNRHVEGWEITGLPEGGAFFNTRGYLPIA